jgi:glycogen operon protein
MFLNGDLVEIDRRGEAVTDDRLLVLLNGWHEPVDFTLPDADHAERWVVDVDTGAGTVLPDDAPVHDAAGVVGVEGRTVMVLRRPRDDG